MPVFSACVELPLKQDPAIASLSSQPAELSNKPEELEPIELEIERDFGQIRIYAPDTVLQGKYGERFVFTLEILFVPSENFSGTSILLDLDLLPVEASERWQIELDVWWETAHSKFAAVGRKIWVWDLFPNSPEIVKVVLLAPGYGTDYRYGKNMINLTISEAHFLQLGSYVALHPASGEALEIPPHQIPMTGEEYGTVMFTAIVN